MADNQSSQNQQDSQNSVLPLLDCVSANSNGTYVAVLGYSNPTGRTATIPYGSRNVITPSKFDRLQPTTFNPGVHHGVFTVTFTYQDIYGPVPGWTLDGTTLGDDDTRVTLCPAGTVMPATGNGTGGAIALAVAGVVGVLLIRRSVRRAGTAGSPVAADHA
jgi:hypothetical protein